MKSKIRIQIEKILGIKYSHVYIDPTNQYKNKWRIKFVGAEVTNKALIDQVLNLPHVIDVKQFKRVMNTRSWGFCVYLDERPSLIKIKKSPFKDESIKFDKNKVCWYDSQIEIAKEKYNNYTEMFNHCLTIAKLTDFKSGMFGVPFPYLIFYLDQRLTDEA